MSDYVSHVALHARQQLTRHLRSPAIWLLAIAGPIAARYLVPEPGAGYSLLAVNDAILRPTASVIGLQLGVITAVMLTPLVYIFLKAGPTRKQPRQVTDVVPRSRSALSLGQWIGDTAALWILLFILALSGVFLSFFRLPLSDVAPFETLIAAFLIAGPTLATIAAIRTFFAMRPWLRRAWGDVLFVVFWMAALSFSAMFFMDGSGASPFIDIFGFASPMLDGTSEPVREMYIGGAPDMDRLMDFDAMAGVSNPAFLGSRLFWFAASAFLAWSAGWLFKPGKMKVSRRKQPVRSGPATFATDPVAPVAATAMGLVSRIRVYAEDIFRPKLLLPVVAAVALAGLVFPLRGMIGPALALILIFPLTRYGARWRPQSVEQWLGTMPVPLTRQFIDRLVVACAACLILLIPSMISLPVGEWRDVAAIGVGLPLIAVGLGHVTRGPVAARLILLILWYGYLNLGPSPF